MEGKQTGRKTVDRERNVSYGTHTCRVLCGESSASARLRPSHTGLAAKEGEGRLGYGSAGATVALSNLKSLEQANNFPRSVSKSSVLMDHCKSTDRPQDGA